MCANASSDVRLSARAITRRFGARLVLDAASLERSGPGVVGLVGHNGAGKTTLLRVLAQLVEPDSGTLEVGGRMVERGDDPPARRLLGWAPSAPLAWMDQTVERNLAYAARLGSGSRARCRELVAAALGGWQLEQVAAQPVGQLSRGWQGRYGLARADLLEPPVLLLDEPTIGLDVEARATLDAAIARWRSSRIVVVASHERAWLDELADEVLELHAPGTYARADTATAQQGTR